MKNSSGRRNLTTSHHPRGDGTPQSSILTLQGTPHPSTPCKAVLNDQQLEIHAIKHIRALQTCTDMHVENISEIRHNGSSHKAPNVGPYHGQNWLFWAMDGSPTMDGLTHHGD